MSPAAGEELYPVKDVAALWHCSVDLIYDLIAAGKLRTVQVAIGRAKTRVPASALAEFVAKQTPRKPRRAA